jgi:succinoglycan biosynthesis transport protein ExoP
MKQIESPYNFSPAPEPRNIFLEEEEGMDLRSYWFAIYRHRRAALVFFFLTLLLAAISIPWGHSTYVATTTLHVQKQIRGMFDGPEAVRQMETDYYATQRSLLLSRSLVAQVIRDLGLETNPYFTEVPQAPLSWAMKQLKAGLKTAVNWVEETAWVKRVKEYFGIVEKEPMPVAYELGVHPALIDQYLQALVVNPLPESELMQVQFSAGDPSLAKKVANSHVATFINRNLETRFELTAETREFLEKKLQELRVNVENSEQALNRFQKEHEIVSLDPNKGSSLMLDQLKQLNTDLTVARSKRIELESLHRVVMKRDNQLLSQIIDNPTIQQLRKQISDLEARRTELGTTYTETHPTVMAVQEQIDEAKGRLHQEINRIVNTIQRDYLAAVAKEKALTAENEKARHGALDLQEKAVEYAVLEREVTSNRALYEAVFKKTKEAALTGGEQLPNLRVIDRAEIPVQPDTAQLKKTLLFIPIGLLGAIGLAFLLHILDTSIRTSDDVMRFLRLPTLGIVPDARKLLNGQARALGYSKDNSPPKKPFKGSNGKNNQLMVSHAPLSLMEEMYRSICTAVLFSKPEKPPQTILITSAQPNEGKTVTAINLSMLLAQSGPVLLIDADLHGGHCHKLLGLENSVGLSNILTGKRDPGRLIKKTSVNNLSLLCRGTLPPNPADLLGSDRMRQTLEALAQHFRFIVIDSAPLLAVSDTVLLSTKVDGVVLVARGQEVSRHVIRKARERLDYVNAKILGVVLNGVDIWNAEYKEYRSVYESHYQRYASGPIVELNDVAPRPHRQPSDHA